MPDRRDYDRVGYMSATLDSHGHRINKLEKVCDIKHEKIEHLLIVDASHSSKIIQLEEDVSEIKSIQRTTNEILSSIKTRMAINNAILASISTIVVLIWYVAEKLPAILTLFN